MPETTRMATEEAQEAAGMIALAQASERAPEAVSAGPLSTIADNVSTPDSKGLSRLRRNERYALREVVRSVSNLSRLRACGCARISANGPVQIRLADGVAHYTNLQHCASPHSCPVCAAMIRQSRAEEIERALTVLFSQPLHMGDGKLCRIEDRGAARLGAAEFLTLTLPHDQGDGLRDLLETVSLAWRRVLGGRGWQQDREEYGIIGTIRSLECTQGKNGWHPHLHVLLLTARPLEDTERRDLLESMYRRWADTVERRGYRRPHRNLCQMDPVRSVGDVSKYITKLSLVEEQETGKLRRVGLEMARHDLKQGRESGSRGRAGDRHRSPFQILADLRDQGEASDLDLWHEWESESKGTRTITWSRGLKALLLVGEVSDEEIVAEEVGGTTVYEVGPDTWSLVVRTGADLMLLWAAEEGGRDTVEAFLRALITDYGGERKWHPSQ